MTENNSNPAAQAVRTVVLLQNAPTGVGPLVGLLDPGAGEKLKDVPLPTLAMNVNGVEMSFSLSQERLEAPELDYAVAQSAGRDLVAAQIAKHDGFVMIGAKSADDIIAASQLLANITARIADDDMGLAVWLPDADHVTTDVLYAGEVDQRPALVTFHTMAARIDENTSLAHTIGVDALGGHNVQLVSTAAPADAYNAVRGAIATLLESGLLPQAGATIDIAGTAHTLNPAQSMIGLGEVLQAAPAQLGSQHPTAAANPLPTADTSGDKPKRRGWFGRR